MPIKNITLIPNTELPKKITPIKEKMGLKIPDIIDGVPNRNGFIWVLTGSGGSGKSSLLLNFMKNPELYRGKFHNIWYICPMSSYLSVEKHPFEEHDKVFHELNEELLDDIYNQLRNIKADSEEQEYSCVIIDDMADALKNNDIQKKLSEMLIKARHLSCAFIFTLQSYYYFPKILRKQITNITIFKPKNAEEWASISKEILHLNKDDGAKVYDYIFDAPYNHLDIDTVSDKIYKNFNLLQFSADTCPQKKQDV
jgi:uncharacterized protein involved in tolerance to divalent cations